MSAANRDRRKWKCPTCRTPMPRGIAEQGEAQRAALIARGLRVPPIVHMCGGCRGMFYLEADGFRPLTPAEEFQIRVTNAAGVARTEAELDKRHTGGGVLVVSRERGPSSLELP